MSTNFKIFAFILSLILLNSCGKDDETAATTSESIMSSTTGVVQDQIDNAGEISDVTALVLRNCLKEGFNF